MKNSNLFLNTRNLTSSKEDHLTEFLAALVTMSKPFNMEFSQLLLAEYAAENGWHAPLIAAVETQVSYPGSNCCPDMRFTLQDGHTILCENKIEALETQGSSSDPRGQLLRYLDLPADGLVYIRATPSHKIAQEVVSHPRFITRNGHHFLWRDLYPLLQGNSNPIVVDVCKGFEVMGFVPAVPAVGTLSDFDATVDSKNRATFKELWQLAADYGLQRNWKVETNKNGELYYSPDEESVAYQVFVTPSQAERFLIRISLRDGVAPDKIVALVEKIDTPIPYEIASYKRLSTRKKEKFYVDVVDITSSLRNVIGDTQDKGEIQKLLLAFVQAFVAFL